MRAIHVVLAVVTFVLLVFSSCAVLPQYSVYSARLDGEAKLAEAQSSRQIAVLEAKAKDESAAGLAHAEVTRAHGVAEANKIIGDSLKGNEAYLHYLWINSLEHTKDQVIYVPTEANIPIMEATRLAPQPPPVKAQ